MSNLNQARVVLMNHRERLESVKGGLQTIDQMVKAFIQAMNANIANVESLMRENSRELVVLAGWGINTDDIESMRRMYAAALENTDKARVMAQTVSPVFESTRNARANLSLVLGAIQRNT